MAKTTNSRLSLARECGDGAKLALLGAWSLALLACAYFTLVAAGRSYTAWWFNDIMALTAAAYRAYKGQVPSIDFFSPFGAAVYYPAALGFWIGLKASVVLAFGQVLVAAILVPAAVLACYRRFSLLPSAVLVLFLFLLIVVPRLMGADPADISFAVFYNRHGWAGLAIVLLYYAEPRVVRRSTLLQDSIVLAVVLLFLFYSTINFAAASMAIVAAFAVKSTYSRKVSILCLGIVAVTLIAVELFTGYNSAYVRDILSLVTARESVARSTYWYLNTVVVTPASLLTACLVSLVILVLGGYARVLDGAFLAGSIAVCGLLATQTSSETRGLPALIAVMVCFVELARRREAENGPGSTAGYLPSQAASLSILGLLVVMAAGPVSGNAFALVDYYRMTAKDIIAPMPGLPPRLSGFLVAPASRYTVMGEVLGHDGAGLATLARLRRKTGGEPSASDYLATIVDGAALLRREARDDQAVVVFDLTDPFTAAVGLRPTRYGYPFFWEGASFSRTVHPPAERYFSDADYVMVPVVPCDQRQLDRMVEIYGPYLEANFEEIARSAYWHLWSRKTGAAANGDRKR